MVPSAFSLSHAAARAGVTSRAAANSARGVRNGARSEACHASDPSPLVTSARESVCLCKMSLRPCETGGESRRQLVGHLTPASMAETF